MNKPQSVLRKLLDVNLARQGIRHTYGSMPADFQSGKKPWQRRLAWAQLQRLLQRKSVIGQATCDEAAHRKHWCSLMLDTGMPPDEVNRVDKETWFHNSGTLRPGVTFRGQAGPQPRIRQWKKWFAKPEPAPFNKLSFFAA